MLSATIEYLLSYQLYLTTVSPPNSFYKNANLLTSLALTRAIPISISPFCLGSIHYLCDGGPSNFILSLEGAV